VLRARNSSIILVSKMTFELEDLLS